MTKKDFELIADILYRERPDKESTTHLFWALTVLRFIDRFNKEYPNFDSLKFHNACYGRCEK